MNINTNNIESQYLKVMKEILHQGHKSDNRTGVPTQYVFGKALELNMRTSDGVYEGFPLLTTKRIHIRSVVHELLWFLKGTEQADYLLDNNIRIWNEWMKPDVQRPDKFILPHTYGVKWRNFNGVDQIANAIYRIKNDPNSRRIIINAWDPATENLAALPWCHCFMQWDVENNTKLNLMVYQRSADWFLGVPFNLASYGLLLAMFCEVTNKIPGKIIYNFGNCHLYENHFHQANIQLSRSAYNLPKLKLNHIDDIDSFTFNDINILDYKCWPTIKGEVSV